MTVEFPVYDPNEYHRRVLDIARRVIRDEADVPTIAPCAVSEADKPRKVDIEPTGPAGRIAPMR